MITPTVSVIIMNYNTAEYLLACLNSVQIACHDLSAQIIVVDNHSTDGSLQMVNKLYPNILTLDLSENQGFAKANNKAINISKGEFVLLLNADTVIPSTGIVNLLEIMKADTNIGMLGPKLVMANGSIDQACFRNLPTISDIIFRMSYLDRLFPKSRYISHYNLSYRDIDTSGVVGSISGACMMLRRRAIEEVGYLDERFFMYAEDLDWAKRFGDKGWLVYYYPAITVIHYKRSSSIKEAEKSIYHFYKSILLYYRKHLAVTNSRLFDKMIFGFVYSRMLLSLVLWKVLKKWI